MSDDAQIELSATENMGRIAARGLVLAGGVFWIVAAFSGPYVFHDTSLQESLMTAFWPFLATAVTLAIGWTHERLAAVLLFAASLAILVWGVLYEWEVGVWILMAFVLFAPILIAAVLFMMTARAESQRVRAMEPQPEAANGDESEASEDPKHSRKTLARSWIVAVLLGVLGFACMVPVYFTATPKQCASCHEMEEYYESWQDSSHVDAAPTCLYCHVEPGLLNLARYEVEFYGEIAAHLAGADVKMAGVSTPGVQSCQREECHSLDTDTFDSEEIRVAHAVHVEIEEITCPECHPGAVHEGVAGRSLIPAMEQCSECHAEQMGDCDYCHGDEVEPEAPDTH